VRSPWPVGENQGGERGKKSLQGKASNVTGGIWGKPKRGAPFSPHMPTKVGLLLKVEAENQNSILLCGLTAGKRKRIGDRTNQKYL